MLFILGRPASCGLDRRFPVYGHVWRTAGHHRQCAYFVKLSQKNTFCQFVGSKKQKGLALTML